MRRTRRHITATLPFNGTPQWVTGKFGSGLLFDGSNQFLRGHDLLMPTDELTITAWIRRDGAQNAFTGLVFLRSGATGGRVNGTTDCGFGFGVNNELRYLWDDGYSNFDSGLIVPDNQWVFVALRVSSTRAVLYLGDDLGLRSATNNVFHAVEQMDARIEIGQDPSSGSRRYRGSMDQVLVYKKALSADEIMLRYQGIDPAADPIPAHFSSPAGA